MKIRERNANVRVRVFHPVRAATARDEGLMAENTADFVAGWASGAVATLCTQPVDLVITRLQAGASGSRTPRASNAPLHT